MQELNKIKNILKYLGNDWKVEYESDEEIYTITYKDTCGDISEETYTEKRRTLNGEKEVEVTGWCAVYVEEIPATYHEPAAYNFTEISCHSTIEQAVKSLAPYLIGVIIDNTIEAIQLEELYK